jgi:hypothetical protein
MPLVVCDQSLLEVMRQADVMLVGMAEALEKVDVFHRFRPRCLSNEAEEDLANKIRTYLKDGCCGWAELFNSPPSQRYVGHQPSLKLRLASRSFSEGWWRWRESNPRPTIFDQLRLHAY